MRGRGATGGVDLRLPQEVYRERTRQRYRDQGLCARCGEHKHTGPETRCIACRMREADQAVERRKRNKLLSGGAV